MTGWNLPPGCNVRDLPGNRPEDEAAEALYDRLGEELLAAEIITPDMPDWRQEKLIELIMRLMGEAHGDGYRQAVEEQKEYEDLKETERLSKEWREGKHDD